MIYQLPGGQWKTPSLGQTEVIDLPGGTWEKRATSGLYVSTQRSPRLLLGADGAWHPMSGTPLPSLGAFGLTAGVEGNFAPGATPEEYATGFSKALGSMTEDVRNQIAVTNPTLGIAIDGMGAIIEATSGKEPGWPMVGEVAKIVANVLVDLLSADGVLGAIVQEVVEAVAQAIGTSVSSVATAIPFVGAFVGMVCQLIEAGTRPSITAQERTEMDGRYRRYCDGFVTKWNVPGLQKGTDPNNAVSLADMFSQNDARAQTWRWLAGGASRDKRVRDSYNSWINRARGAYGITGIPLHIMRQMNEMMDGVFAARRDPSRKAGAEIFTDNGAGVGGILLHVTRDQMVLGAFNEASCQSLADNFIAPGKRVCVTAEYPKAGQTCDQYPPCGQHHLGVKFGVAFHSFIMGYDVAIMDPHSPLYIDAERAAEEARKAKNKFTLSPAMAAKLTVKVQGTKAIAEEAAVLVEEQFKANMAAKRGSAAKAAAWSSAVLLGGGGFMMARRAAKKRRR